MRPASTDRRGAGLVEALGLGDAVTVQMGTLGKALGAAGAFVAGSRALVELLVNRARSLIYTTALPPPVVAAVDAALDVVAREPERRARLATLAATLRARLARARLRDPAGRGSDHPGDRPAAASARSPGRAGCSSAASSCRRSARRPFPTARRACASR